MCWKSEHVRAAWFATAVPRPAPPAGLGAARQQTGTGTDWVMHPQHRPRGWRRRWDPREVVSCPPSFGSSRNPRKSAPFLSSWCPPATVVGAGVVPLPAASGIGDPGCTHPLCPVLSAPLHAWALPPAPSLKSGDLGALFPAPSSPVASQWCGGLGGTSSVVVGAHGKPSPGETSNWEPQNIRFPPPRTAFAKICERGRAAALLRHRKNPKAGARGGGWGGWGTCAPSQGWGAPG